MLSLKPTVGDFVVLVFCESIKLASLGRQYREKQAPYVTGNFLLSFGVNRMKSRISHEWRCQVLDIVLYSAYQKIAALFPI